LLTKVRKKGIFNENNKKVSIQPPAGDSENWRNEGAFSPEMSRLGAKEGGSPLCKSTRGQKKF
jgi:hypothetical protein